MASTSCWMASGTTASVFGTACAAAQRNPHKCGASVVARHRPSAPSSEFLHRHSSQKKETRTSINKQSYGTETQQTAPFAVRAQAGSVQTFKERVVPKPDFRIPIVLLGTAGALLVLDQKLAAAPIGLLGALLAFQATRVRFLFDEDSLEVVIGEKAEKSGENVFVGGENRWKYSTFTNWEFWWPNFPVLVYFKETQTKPEGQIHFFPIIANGKELYDVMVERCGPTQNSGPDVDRDDW